MSIPIDPISGGCPFCGDRGPLAHEFMLGGVECCGDCFTRIDKCPDCNGSGLHTQDEVVIDDPCRSCYGLGYSGETCPYTGFRYCEDRGCARCRDRARDQALEAAFERWHEETHRA